MKYLIHQIRASEFLRHNLVFFVGSFAVSAINYLYYPVLGRMLPTTQFGEVQTLVSLFLQANIFLGVVAVVAVNIVANEHDEKLRNRTVYELERLAGLIVLASVTVALIFVQPLKEFFQFPDVAPFFALGAALVASAPFALRTAFLRGRSAFATLSTANIIASVAKLVASAGLVLIGMGTFGAIGGLVIAQLIALLYARRKAAFLGLSGSAGALLRRPDISLIKPQLPYTILVLIVSLVTTTLFSFDILVVKHYFSGEIAGLYAGVATIARIIYFLTGSFAGVLLSNIKLTKPLAKNRALLVRSAMLQLVIGGGVLAVFTLLPNLVIRILIGARYEVYAGLLPTLSLALFILAFVNLLLSYDLALRRRSAAVISIVGMTITAIWIVLAHGTPEQVVYSLLWSSLVFFAIRGLDSLRRRIM
jgi:O-antigen/teichoic acid export membrane protein